MSGHIFEEKYPVIKNWDEMKNCPCARKCWVNPSNVDLEKKYEKGDFLRVYCDHDGRWCDAEFGYENCAICEDHRNE